MAEGHGRDEWARMSVLLALTANCYRDPKKHRAFKPGDFDPFSNGDGERSKGSDVIEVNRENIGLMKQMFLGKKENHNDRNN